ncbi:MAG: hypothetical protein ABTQ25_08335 [Nitrosomonas ureae]
MEGNDNKKEVIQRLFGTHAAPIPSESGPLITINGDVGVTIHIESHPPSTSTSDVLEEIRRLLQAATKPAG